MPELNWMLYEIDPPLSIWLANQFAMQLGFGNLDTYNDIYSISPPPLTILGRQKRGPPVDHQLGLDPSSMSRTTRLPEIYNSVIKGEKLYKTYI